MDGPSERRDERRSFDVGPCVGAGGFGEVYAATMTSAGGVSTKVALKVLHHGLDPRSQAVQRLADEAKLLGILDHPSILRIHDLVLLDERITLVTEYVAGADLDRCTSDPSDPIPARAVLQAGAQVAAALHAAYRTPGPDGQPLRLLHRDIKPSNVRIGRHGEVKLLDFGIAKAAGERVAKTQTNALIGSFTYMSPERLDKEGNDDAPGDVFSLGCTLFEALAGRELFDGTIRELYRLSMDPSAHQGHVAEQIAGLPVHDGVKSMVRQMLAYAPGDRPTAGELAESLEDLAEDTPGLTLTRWARAHGWPDEGVPDGGQLSGRTITEMAISGATLQAHLTQEMEVPDGDATYAFERGMGDTTEEMTEDGAAKGRTSPTMVIDEGDVDLPTVEHTDDADVAPVLPPAPAASPDGEAAEGDGAPEAEPALSTVARWGGVAALGVLSTVAGGVLAAVVLVAGVAWMLSQDRGTPAVDGGEVAEGTAPEADERPTEADTPDVEPQGDGARAPAVPRPSAPPADGAAPADGAPGDVAPAAQDGVADASEAARGDGAARCGEPATLEPAALVGRLPGSTTACLAGAMVDHALPQVDRATMGRILLVDARARCDAGGGCDDYEAHQRAFFEEVTRSDADMVLGFATFLGARATDEAARREAILWASRGLELKQSWSGNTHIRHTDTLQALIAEQTYRLFEASPRDDRLRVQARNASLDWMNLRLDRGQDAAPALALCASVEGSEEACRKRSHDVGARFVVTLISRPMGAVVFVDGQQVGVTPVTAELNAGSHELRMTVGGQEATQAIEVGAEQPTRWSWSSADGQWTSTL